MRKVLALILGLTIASFVSPVNPVTFAQQVTLDPTKGQLTGIAKTAAGQVKPNSVVKLIDANGNVVEGGTATTSANGAFTFTNINPGSYTLQIFDNGVMVGVAGNVTITAGVITTAAVTGVTAATAAAGLLITSATTAAVVAGALTIAGTTIAVVANASTASPSR